VNYYNFDVRRNHIKVKYKDYEISPCVEMTKFWIILVFYKDYEISPYVEMTKFWIILVFYKDYEISPCVEMKRALTVVWL
jgi:hypothetical protein